MMFAPQTAPRLFGVAPGIDYSCAVVGGLRGRCAGMQPHEIAGIEIFVNTGRMQRRLREVFDQGPPGLLPRIRLIADLAHDPLIGAEGPVPAAASPLRRRLELSRFVTALIEAEPDLAPRSAIFDLSDSLATLLEEMQGEKVSPEALAALDTGAHSAHWARTQRFLDIIARYFDAAGGPPDAERRRRLVVEARIAAWHRDPPLHPVLVVGTTGSRGTTALFMDAVARLPQGAVILPGFDFDLPQQVYDFMIANGGTEEHPQHRHALRMAALGLVRDQVAPWDAGLAPPAAPRNALISLALRPAPVTDQWLSEGPGLGDLGAATSGVTLIEAPTQRDEAAAIALRLREAVENGETAALITPDRLLTRRVAAALEKWRLVADDSAGTPLAQSAPGRFLRQVADLRAMPLTAARLLALLRHPLMLSGHADRGQHLLNSRELELFIRRKGVPFPDAQTLAGFAKGDAGRAAWLDWVTGLCCTTSSPDPAPLADHVRAHVALAGALAAGPGRDGSGGLWDEAAGRRAQAMCDALQEAAPVAGQLTNRDYTGFFAGIIAREEVRRPDIGHPDIRIWGTLEARVQSADLIILAGLNEDVWPPAPGADPWLNRAMRRDAGLLSPERQVGLSAHDFQQAAAAKEIWLSRSKRGSESETVASRWLNRIVNLLGGLDKQAGTRWLDTMRGRGQDWLDRSRALSVPEAQTPPLRIASAPRPSPRPPVAVRPRRLSVTEIETLLRDPYAIYARRVLRLQRLDPLTATADAPRLGTALHRIVELFIAARPDPRAPGAAADLMAIGEKVFEEQCPWPTVRQIWLARLERVVPEFLEGEVERQARGQVLALEARGEIDLPGLSMRIIGKADRIDRDENGLVSVYDYKSSDAPDIKKQKFFTKQLLIEAPMIERGAFAAIGEARVAHAEYVSLKADGKSVAAPLADAPPDKVWQDLIRLIRAWEDPRRGYSAHMASEPQHFGGDYDQLARFGEWDIADAFAPEDLA